MGRPIRDQWTNEIRATHVTLEGLPPGNEIITGLCKIGANDVAKYTIVQQKGTNRFRVQDAAGNEGTCTLVNKPADLSAGTTDPVLLADEMVMNCLDSGAVKHRVMKLMNRTLDYETDANVSKRAMWSWASAAPAAGTNIETVQLQEIETVFAPAYVTYNGQTEFCLGPLPTVTSTPTTINIGMDIYLDNSIYNRYEFRGGDSFQQVSTFAAADTTGAWFQDLPNFFYGAGMGTPFSLEINAAPQYTSLLIVHATIDHFAVVQRGGGWDPNHWESSFFFDLVHAGDVTYMTNWINYGLGANTVNPQDGWTFKIFAEYQGP